MLHLYGFSSTKKPCHLSVPECSMRYAITVPCLVANITQKLKCRVVKYTVIISLEDIQVTFKCYICMAFLQQRSPQFNPK